MAMEICTFINALTHFPEKQQSIYQFSDFVRMQTVDAFLSKII